MSRYIAKTEFRSAKPSTIWNGGSIRYFEHVVLISFPFFFFEWTQSCACTVRLWVAHSAGGDRLSRCPRRNRRARRCCTTLNSRVDVVHGRFRFRANYMPTHLFFEEETEREASWSSPSPSAVGYRQPRALSAVRWSGKGKLVEEEASEEHGRNRMPVA